VVLSIEDQNRIKASLAEAVLDSLGEFRWNKFCPHDPTERQQLFLDLECLEAFYGGAAGGGKSDALLMAALQYVHVPKYAAILFRRTYTDLTLPEALMTRAQEWLSRHKKVRWVDKEKTWYFPSGATITFGYLESENDKFRYQSSAFQFIGFDEASQFTEGQYTYLFSRLRRLSDSDVPLRMRAASNPGGIGAAWVYSRFIPEDFTPDQSVEVRLFQKTGTNDEGDPIDRAFVPARLDDNPHLDRAGYARSLANLDPVTRAQLLRGDWLIKERGNILSMWDENVHVITWGEFRGIFGQASIPDTWLVSVYQDWGTTAEHPCVTTWFATVPQNGPTVNGVKMAGQVFAYRSLMTWDSTVREVATIIDAVMSGSEKGRCQRWLMSHEASSERIAYRREHALPFSAWETGKTRGIAQLRNALECIETDKPHPFRPELHGHPKLYLLVDDNELVNPKTDKGFARHRAEFPAYHWATLKSGEPLTNLIPYALFNDAVDTVRAAAADYWPQALELTPAEQVNALIPDRYKYNTLLAKSPYTNGLTAEQEMSFVYQQERAKKLVAPKNVTFDEDYAPINMDSDSDW
jgi:Terminase-like family.